MGTHISGGVIPKIDTFGELDNHMTVFVPGTNNTFFWPFLESSGDRVKGWGDGIEEELDVTVAGSSVGLNADATGLAPYLHAGGVHSYQFILAESPALVGADVATLSFNGTTDVAFSVGCWFYRVADGGTLIAKYDVAGTLREWKLDINSNDLRFLLFDESANVEEGTRTTTALNLGQWYFGVATYSGVGGNGSGAAGDGCTLYIDGSSVTDTDIDDASYVDMENTTAPLMIGATDDKAAPASEFTGRIALPFIVTAELTSANVTSLYNSGRRLLGI